MQKFHMAYPARFVRGSSFDTLATFTRKRHLKRKVDKVTPSLLLHQVNLVPKIRLLPSQSKLLSKYQSFLSLNFLESIEHELVNDGSEYHELNTILAKVYSQNESFAAYTDACLQTAELRQMLRTLDSRRKSSRMEKNLDKGTVVISDAVFELLCRHFAARNDWLSLEKTLNWLQEDGIAPTFNICLASLECIGGLLHLSVKGRAPPKALNNFLSAEERLLHSFLENKVIEVVSLAEKHGINVYSGLLRYPRRKYSLQKILTALLFATPDKQADISFHPATSQLSSSPTSAVAMRVSRALDRAVLSPNNLFSDVFQSSAAMMEAFREQLQLETFGQVPIPPALPCFEQMLPEASKSPPSGKLSDRLTQQRQSLLKEQNNSWRRQLTAAFEGTLQRLKIAHTQGRVTAYPFLKILPKKSYVDMMIQAVDTIVTNSELQHVSRSLFLQRLGERVEAACLVWRKQNAGIIDELAKVYENYAAMFTNSTRSTEHFREMWLRSLQMNAESGVSLDPEWPQWNTHLRLLVGQELYRILYDHLTFDLNGGKVDREPKTKLHQEAPVLFEVMSEQPGDARYEIRVHPTLLRWYRAAGHPPLVFDATELPMLCPPIPWIDTKRAGYLLASSDATRFIRKTSYFPGADTAANDDLDFDANSVPMVFDSLNALASCAWKVNVPLLDAMLRVAREGGDKDLSIPEIKSLVPIPRRKFDSSLSREERIKAYKQFRSVRKAHDETRSLWATEMYRLSIANQYRDKVFWFPHSMDFRGRVYPCPPHFHHMGSDVARGLIVFAKGLPLGDNGLRWLKIHLANLTGKVKRSSNDEREAYTESKLEEVFDSVDRPFEGRGWWREQEEPWQTLACCRELVAALRHAGGPSTFVNHYPVHQDGSCNGLQHYAAMGRDERGAASVSLEDCERPRDVYSDVTEVVEAQRKVDAAAGVAVAQVLEGFVQRKVIKQSVMTTVYGVTLYGAMAQIRRQLRDLPTFPSPEQWLVPASAYLARITLASIGAIFTSSSATQAWFGKLAKHITRTHGCRISWVTPLGLPVIQPYVRQPACPDLDAHLWSGESLHKPVPLDLSVLTKAANLAERYELARSRSVGAKDSLVGLPPPNPIKQKNAFPPNFIHSLDSCHMMLTALHCLREGVMFASVHDCFWTHAASVDRMNRICREEFVALHSEDIMANLSDYLRGKFEYSQDELDKLPAEKRVEAENFNTLLRQFPKRGTFDLNKVLTSTYFFS